MSQPPEQPPGIELEVYILRGYDATGLRDSQRVSTFCEQYGVDPALAEQYGGTVATAYHTGNPSTDTSRDTYIAHRQTETLDLIDTRYSPTAASRFIVGLKEVSGLGRDTRRDSLEGLIRLLPGGWQHPVIVGWKNTVHATGERGIRRSLLLDYLLKCMAKDAPLLFGPEAVTSEASAVQPELSQAALIERFNAFVATMQIELTSLFIEDLRELGSLGSGAPRQSASILFRKYRTHLFTDDLPIKLQMLQELSARYLRLSNPSNDDRNDALSILASRSLRLVGGAEEALDRFRNAFVIAAYDLPELLRPPEAEVAVAVGATAVAPTVEELLEEAPTVDPEILAEASRRGQELRSRAEPFQRAWVATHNARQPFRALLSQLGRGVPRGNGEAWPPVANAQEVVDTLIRLGIVGTLSTKKTLEQAAKSLARAVGTQEQIDTDAAELRHWADERGLPYRSDEYPHIPNLRSLLAQISANWPHFREAMHRNWPNNEGIVAAERIRALLDAYTQRDASP